MRNEAKANEATDRAEKERVDKVNAADSMIFSTEKQLKEYGDKIPADKKTAIETALGALKEAHKSADLDAIDRTTKELNDAWQAASQDMYAAGQQAQGGDAGAGASGAGAGSTSGAQGDNVTDVDFEEVK
jgi:molecular chaperone DnaK